MSLLPGPTSMKRERTRKAVVKTRRIAVQARTLDRKKLLRQADGLCRQIVFQRDGGCVRCGDLHSGGGGSLQWAHVYSRNKGLSLRLDPDGSMVLCAGHHLWWHNCPTEASQWWRLKYPGRATRLGMIRATQRRPDVAAIVLRLGQILEVQ